MPRRKISFKYLEVTERTYFRVCVCACVPSGVTRFLLDCFEFPFAGECSMIVGPHSMKLPQSWDTESDQLGVPAVLPEKLHRGSCF